MPAPLARDACPGLLTLHPARDGQVARIRLPGGYVSGPRWRALARLARDFGDGGLDVTARGNVQLRGLPATAAGPLAQGAARAGLLPSGAHDRARNISASPLAGLGGRPDVRRLVGQLDRALIADPALAALPGRFWCAVDDGAGGAGLAGCDIGLRRAGRDLDLVLAGRITGVRARTAGAIAAVLTAARAALAGGVGHDVTRIKDLADGGAAVAASIGGSLGPTVRADPGRLRLGLGPAAGPGDDPVVIVAAPLGRLTAAQLALTGSLLRAGEVIRLAPAGRLVIAVSGPPGPALVTLAQAGLVTTERHELAGVTACSGLACHRALADVRAAARPLPGLPRTHWAGCARQCGRPADAEPVIAAGPDTYLTPGRPQVRPLAFEAATP